ncbi:MAG: transcription elongation factor GreA [Patescibacteria group bacterium]
MNNQKQTYITEEGLKKLEEELEYLKNTKRKKIAERIRDAKELGDLSENAEYAEAKEEQGFVESRVLELQSITRNVNLIKKSKKANQIDVGSTIEVENAEGNKMTYTIVGSNEANPPKGLISNESPIGKAFLGKKVGEEAEVEAPSGKITFKVLKIS